jgi:hypothetical protein
MTLQVGGGLLAGAALIGGGYLAWQHHQKKTEQEVSFSPHYNFRELTIVEETRTHVGCPVMAN